MNVTMYHNPRCSKSRQTLQLLRDHGIEPQLVEYLKTPPGVGELKSIISRLGFTSARDLMRCGEKEYKELGLSDPAMTEDELIAAMVAHPRLIERPIVITSDGIVLGRPPESVLSLFD